MTRPLRVITGAELDQSWEEDAIYQQWLPHWHPDHAKGFRYIRETNEIDLRWNHTRQPYCIDIDRITTPLWLLHWVAHIGEKQWPFMTPYRVRRLIESVCQRKGWNLWQPDRTDGIPVRGTSADQERAKLTPRLRWRVLERDGHRCRSCGLGPEHGAVLHIDHVLPIALGGVTSFDNLQALCVACNSGKGSKR